MTRLKTLILGIIDDDALIGYEAGWTTVALYEELSEDGSIDDVTQALYELHNDDLIDVEIDYIHNTFVYPHI